MKTWRGKENEEIQGLPMDVVHESRAYLKKQKLTDFKFSKNLTEFLFSKNLTEFLFSKNLTVFF